MPPGLATATKCEASIEHVMPDQIRELVKTLIRFCAGIGGQVNASAARGGQRQAGAIGRFAQLAIGKAAREGGPGDSGLPLSVIYPQVEAQPFHGDG